MPDEYACENGDKCCNKWYELRRKLNKAEEQRYTTGLLVDKERKKGEQAVIEERGKGMVAIKEALDKLYAKMQLEIQSLDAQLLSKELLVQRAKSEAELYKKDFEAAIEREDALEEIRNKEYAAKVQLENELRERRSELSAAESKAEMYKEDFEDAIKREDALEDAIEKRKAFQAEWRNRAMIAERCLDKIVGMASRSHMCKKCGYPMDEVFPGTWRCCECGFSEVETMVEETKND